MIIMLELYILAIDWDIIYFSETRLLSQGIILNRKHPFIINSNFGNLWHRDIDSLQIFLPIDIKIASRMTQIVWIYLPHTGYHWEAFSDPIHDITCSNMEVQNQNYGILVSDDFNLSLDIASRDDAMQISCSQLSFFITNRYGSINHPHRCRCRSSIWEFRWITFIYSSVSLQYIHVEIIDSLGLWSSSCS